MFQARSFTPASFSIQSFKMAEASSARSGYWRLFYYNLQAESLKKNEQKQREEAPEGTSQSPSEVARTVSKKSRRKPAVVEEWVPPALPKPIYRLFEKPAPALDISPILRELVAYQSFLATLQIRLTDFELEKEEEDDVEFLLLHH